MTLRKSLFEYMDLETREQYLAHRTDFNKNVNRWKLNDRSRGLLLQATEIAWDVETIPKPPSGTYLHLTDGVRNKLGLTYLTDVTHVVFYSIVDGEEVTVVLVAPFADEELDFVRELFSRNNCLFITQNGVFDYRIFCGHHNLPVPQQTYCTLVGQTTMMGGQDKGMYPDGSNRSLESLIHMYDVFDYVAAVDQRVTPEWLSMMKGKRNVLHTLPAADVAVYVVTDGVGTYWVYKKQMYWSRVMQEQYGYDALWERHQEDQAYQNVLNYWAVRGMPVNREWIKEQLVRIQQEKMRWIPYFMDRGCGSLSKAVEKFRFLFHVCECPTPDPWEYVDFGRGRGRWYSAEMQGNLWTESAYIYFTKNGWSNKNWNKWYSTGADAVEYYLKFGPEEHRSKLRLYKWYTGMISQEATYREWLDHSSYDGKIHSQLSMTANTGRTITRTPNLQNVKMDPSREIQVYDPNTRGVRSVAEFTGLGMLAPHPGKALLEFDASNAEVRFAAIISKAKGLASAFADNLDLHRENAAVYYKVSAELVTKQQRRDSKTFFFGEQYGAGTRSLASNPKILLPLVEVEQMVNGWNEANREVGIAKKRIEHDALQLYQRMKDFPLPAARQAYTVLYNGRWVPAPMSYGKFKLYALWNTQQQGGVGGIAAAAIIKAHRYFQDHPELESDMYLMVHDSIILEVPDDDEEAMLQAGEYVAKQLMTQVPLELTVVDEIPVPWPSGCDLYENQHKWGWRPGQEFPYYCGEDEGEVVITYPEDAAWEVMQRKALRRINKNTEAVLREKEQLYQQPPAGYVPWRNFETGKIDPCVPWQSTVQYCTEQHYAQSRFWGEALRMGGLDENVVKVLTSYREWVARLYQIELQLKELQGQYGQTEGFRVSVS